MIRLLSYFLLFLFMQTQPLDQKKLTGQASNPKDLLEKETQEAFDLMKFYQTDTNLEPQI
jgi:hypothetical protein